MGESLFFLGGAVAMHDDVTIRGEPGPVLRDTLGDLTVRRGKGVTVLSTDLDQPALHGLLAPIGDLGLELVAVRSVADPGRHRKRNRR